jgi:hypothetical protein
VLVIEMEESGKKLIILYYLIFDSESRGPPLKLETVRFSFRLHGHPVTINIV